MKNNMIFDISFLFYKYISIDKQYLRSNNETSYPIFIK